MSSTNRSNRVTNPDDFYATPTWCTHAILKALQVRAASVLDPCCGEGAILDAAAEFYGECVDLRGLELNEGRAASAREGAYSLDVITCDALGVPWPASPLVLINPPFSLAEEFIRKAREELPEATCAVLLRLGMLAGQKRAALHREYPSDVYVLPRRPSFTGKGTDSADYMWAVFGPGRGGKWSRLETGALFGAVGFSK